MSVGCPSQCQTDCDDYLVSMSVSSSIFPGMHGYCGEFRDHLDKLACLVRYLGPVTLGKVCKPIELFNETETSHHVRRMLCPEKVQTVLDKCNGSGTFEANRECLSDVSGDDINELLEAYLMYGRHNLLMASVMFKERYFTSMKRDVTYTWPSLVANVGGLLGLCMGCSLISLVEIFFFTAGKVPDLITGKCRLLSGRHCP